MLLWSTVIQITQNQLSINTHFWVINWKPHIEIFPERPPCIYAIWLTEVKSYNSRTAITHFLTPGTHTWPKITMRIIHPRWYRPTPLAHGLSDGLYCLIRERFRLLLSSNDVLFEFRTFLNTTLWVPTLSIPWIKNSSRLNHLCNHVKLFVWHLHACMGLPHSLMSLFLYYIYIYILYTYI